MKLIIVETVVLVNIRSTERVEIVYAVLRIENSVFRALRSLSRVRTSARRRVEEVCTRHISAGHLRSMLKINSPASQLI